jgi:hypothetical protein
VLLPKFVLLIEQYCMGGLHMTEPHAKGPDASAGASAPASLPPSDEESPLLASVTN